MPPALDPAPVLSPALDPAPVLSPALSFDPALDLVLDQLLPPLVRLVGSMCLGLLLAGFLETLHWTRFVARLASPLARLGHLREVSAASFALAFFSPAASNALLAESHAKGELSRRELLFANLFNSSPSFLVHLPTLFSLVFAFLGSRAFIYVGLTFAAAFLRTAGTVAAGRFLLPPPPPGQAAPLPLGNPKTWREAVFLTLGRFKSRIARLLVFTIPIYCLFFAAQQAGWFATLEHWLARHADWFAFLDPKALGIVALHLVAESGAALSAAASLADTGALGTQQIIMALMVGSILSAPLRAIRHQFPTYAGYFPPALALNLVIANQLCRVFSMAAVAAGYYWCVF